MHYLESNSFNLYNHHLRERLLLSPLYGSGELPEITQLARVGVRSQTRSLAAGLWSPILTLIQRWGLAQSRASINLYWMTEQMSSVISQEVSTVKRDFLIFYCT